MEGLAGFNKTFLQMAKCASHHCPWCSPCSVSSLGQGVPMQLKGRVHRQHVLLSLAIFLSIKENIHNKKASIQIVNLTNLLSYCMHSTPSLFATIRFVSCLNFLQHFQVTGTFLGFCASKLLIWQWEWNRVVPSKAAVVTSPKVPITPLSGKDKGRLQQTGAG